MLSLVMMDSSLTSGYHMEGNYDANGNPGSYMYNEWWPSQNKLWYIKNSQGNPWDINLYDSQFIYQWVTELGKWNSVNYWNDPKSCKKFNNGFSNFDGHDSDESFIWAARCAVPGGANSSFWNPKPTSTPQDFNSRYYAYIDQVQQNGSFNIDNALLELKGPGTIAIYWGGSSSTESWTANTITVQYTYNCSTQGDVNSCTAREVFDYAYDANPNPHDGKKHGYGWVRWRLYKNSTNPAQWMIQTDNSFNHVVSGATTENFQCF